MISFQKQKITAKLFPKSEEDAKKEAENRLHSLPQRKQTEFVTPVKSIGRLERLSL